MRSLSWGAVVGAALMFAVSAAAEPLDRAVMRLDRDSAWTQVSATRIGFDAFHAQGMVRVGDSFFVSSVEILERTTPYPTPRDGFDRSQGRGQGWLFKMSATGELLAKVKLGEGAMYHAGGLDFDGRWLWIPSAEYRPGGPSVVYRVDPQTLAVTEAFRVADHIGAVAWDSGARRLVGVNWDGRQFYAWPADRQGRVGRPAPPRANIARYIGYQDCHGAGPGRMLCGGVATYRPIAQGPMMALGGLELVDLKTLRPLWQAPVMAWSARGAVMTSNAAFLEPTAEGVRGYFLPEDGQGPLYVYDIRPRR